MPNDVDVVEQLRSAGGQMYINELRSTPADAAIYRSWKAINDAADDEITRLRAELVEERHTVLELQRELYGPLPSGRKTRAELECDRLRAELAEAKKDAAFWCNDAVEKLDRLRTEAKAMREALRHAEAIMSIVPPRTAKAEYLAALDAVRAALAQGGGNER